ncbi:hypothetical protein GEMRC1_002899 [Eukaryota sp. GEM-RC1]
MTSSQSLRFSACDLTDSFSIENSFESKSGRSLKDFQTPWVCRAARGLVVYPTVKKNQTIYRLCRIDVETPPYSKVFLSHDLVSPESLALGSTSYDSSIFALFYPDSFILYEIGTSTSTPQPVVHACHKSTYRSPVVQPVGCIASSSSRCRVFLGSGQILASQDVILPLIPSNEPFLSNNVSNLSCVRIRSISASPTTLTVLTDDGLRIFDHNLQQLRSLSRSDIVSVSYVVDELLGVTTSSELIFLTTSLQILYRINLPSTASPWIFHSSHDSFFTLHSGSQLVIGRMDGVHNPRAMLFKNPSDIHPSNPIVLGNTLAYFYASYSETSDKKPGFVLWNCPLPASLFDPVSPLELPVTSSPPPHPSASVVDFTRSHSFFFSTSHLCSCFRDAREARQLVDTTITFCDQTNHYHSYMISLFSEVLKTETNRSLNLKNFNFLEQLLEDSSLFFSVMNAFYGSPISCSPDNFHNVTTIADKLKITQLQSFIQSQLRRGLTDTEFQFDSTVICQEFFSKAPRDVVLKYKGAEIPINSLLLSCLSKFFQNSFNSGFSDASVRRFEYNDEFYGVEEEIFVEFIGLFICESITLTVSNLLSFHQLATYFDVPELNSACDKFLSEYRFTASDLNFLLTTANERRLINFINTHINLFRGLPSSISFPPIRLIPELLDLLFPVIDNWWLLRCLVQTSIASAIEAEKLGAVLKLVNITEKIIPDYIIHISNIPKESYLWCLQAFDKHQGRFPRELNHCVDIFTSVIPSSALNDVVIDHLSPMCFKLLAKQFSESHSIWLSQKLIEIFGGLENNQLWTIDELKLCVLSIDLSRTDPVEVLNILKVLKNDERLVDFIKNLHVDNFASVAFFQQNQINDLKSIVETQSSIISGYEAKVSSLELLLNQLLSHAPHVRQPFPGGHRGAKERGVVLVFWRVCS